MGNGWTLAFKQYAGIFFREAFNGYTGAWKHKRIAGIDDNDLTEHLPDDDFDVLIGDSDTLGGINLLNFFDHLDFDFLDVTDFKKLLRIDGTFGDLSAIFDLIALLNP